MKNVFSTLWTGGQLFAFSGIDGQTAYVNDLIFRTAFNGCALELKAPLEGGAIVFDTEQPRFAEFSCDFFQLETSDGKKIRGAMVNTYHCLIEGDCIVCGLAHIYYYVRKGNKLLIGIKEFFDSKLLDSNMDEIISCRRRWQENISIPENATMALKKALSQLKGQINSPAGNIKHHWTTPDRWPHKRMWLWDSVFHAIGLRHIDIALARETVLAVFDQQQNDGFIAHMVSPENISSITQPPVLAYGALKLHEISPDLPFLAEVYKKNTLFLNWIIANRDHDKSGLVVWKNSDEVHCRCDESGMDNSPRFDDYNKWKAVDFNAFLAHEYLCMAKIAEILELPEAQNWHNRLKKLNTLINKYMWDEINGLYVDYDKESDSRSPILSSAGFLPLLSLAPTPEKAKRLVATLNDPIHFGGYFPVSSISRTAEKFYKKDMWRGPTWININYFIIEGLEKNGLHEEAVKLRNRTIEELEKQFNRYGTFFEFYDDRGECDPPELMRKGKCDPVDRPWYQAFFDYGWSATLYIDMFLTADK